MEYFNTIGSLISSRWKARNYNEECFPDVALTALRELPPHEHVTPWDIVRWGVVSDRLPHQADLRAEFGDPPLTLYTGRQFRIEALFWCEGIPAIHQHGFSGAFHVLHGSSIHSLWDFEPRERVELRLILGNVVFKAAELLNRGDSRQIIAGDRMFHATYHMERPSVTIVVRTLSEEDRMPQYTLLPPTLAYAPLSEIPTIKRQSQLLRMLLISNKQNVYQQIANYLVGSKDAYSVFSYLVSTLNGIEDDEERQTILTMARLKHPYLIESLEPALERERSGSQIVQMYRATHVPDLKFFLALLRNLPDQESILQLTKRRYPSKDPIPTVVDWIRQLSGYGLLGVTFQKSWLLMLQCVLMKYTGQRIQEEFSRSGPELSALGSSELEYLEDCIREYWLFKPLMSNRRATSTSKHIQTDAKQEALA